MCNFTLCSNYYYELYLASAKTLGNDGWVAELTIALVTSLAFLVLLSTESANGQQVEFQIAGTHLPCLIRVYHGFAL